MNPEDIICANITPCWEQDDEQRIMVDVAAESAGANGIGDKKDTTNTIANQNCRDREPKFIARRQRLRAGFRVKTMDEDGNNNTSAASPRKSTTKQYEEVTLDCETQEIAMEFSDWDGEEFADAACEESNNITDSRITEDAYSDPPSDPSWLYTKVHKPTATVMACADIQTNSETDGEKDKKWNMKKSTSIEQLNEVLDKKRDRNSKFLLALSKPFHSLRAIAPKSPNINLSR